MTYPYVRFIRCFMCVYTHATKNPWKQNVVDRHLPAGTRRNDNVFITSKRHRRRRFDVMKTLSLRHYCVMCPLGCTIFFIHLFIDVIGGWYASFCITNNRHGVTITTRVAQHHFLIWWWQWDLWDAGIAVYSPENYFLLVYQNNIRRSLV